MTPVEIGSAAVFIVATVATGYWAVAAKVTRWADAVAANTDETRKLRQHLNRQERRQRRQAHRHEALERRVAVLERR